MYIINPIKTTTEVIQTGNQTNQQETLESADIPESLSKNIQKHTTHIVSLYCITRNSCDLIKKFATKHNKIGTTIPDNIMRQDKLLRKSTFPPILNNRRT